MHFGIVLCHFPPLSSRPDHERIHGSLDMLVQVTFRRQTGHDAIRTDYFRSPMVMVTRIRFRWQFHFHEWPLCWVNYQLHKLINVIIFILSTASTFDHRKFYFRFHWKLFNPLRLATVLLFYDHILSTSTRLITTFYYFIIVHSTNPGAPEQVLTRQQSNVQWWRSAENLTDNDDEFLCLDNRGVPCHLHK